ncbi:MAG: choice-of-anchor D domain-containing protein [Deltaproteobacteria bacterium]|nr:choice-of-anchor D domain-containing protein [Deltaproteobacteria bacterium]MBI3294198.1 choice-of-anchor D domain-containing protein [Deltaproteobacteria bacterium]
MYVGSCSQIKASLRFAQYVGFALILAASAVSCRKQKKDSDKLISGPANLVATNGPIDFGTASVGGTVTANLTLSNNGGLLASAPQPKSLTAPFTFLGGYYPGVGGTCGLVIQVGETCTVVLAFSPTSSGAATGELFLTYYNGVDSKTVLTSDITQLTGAASDGAVLSISNGATYDYGTIVIGNTSDKSFTVTNTGTVGATAMAAGTPAMAAPFTFKGGAYPGTGGTCGATLAASGTCTVVVRYTPSAAVLSSDTLRLTYNDGTSTQSATRAMQGTGQTPASLSVSDGATYTYPDTYETLTADKTFTVTNAGSATATSFSNTTPALAAPYGYKGGSYPGTGGTCGASLAGSATCTLIVTYSPTATGATSSTINLTYNDGVATQTASRDVAGTGLGYASLSISDGATYSFGSKYINTTNTDKSFTVTNSQHGSATVVSGAALSAPYTYKGGAYPGTGGTCGNSIGSLATCTIVVRFSPTALGAASDTLTVNYTLPDASTSSATRAMTGTGIGNPGSLDTTFNTTGQVASSIGSADAYGYAVALQSDGKIVVAGSSYNGSDTDFAVARYSTAGALDASFGTGGKVSIDVSAGGNDVAYAVVIQADGKVLVGGSAATSGDLNFSVVRLTSAGAIDTAYGTSGIAITQFNGQDDVLRGLALDSNGKAVAVGYSISLAGKKRFAIARYGTDGTADTTFNTTGRAVFSPIANSQNDCYALSILSSGKIVMAGTALSGTYQFAVAQVSSVGAIDTDFGTSGYTTVDVTAGTDIVKAMAIDSSSNIVLGGVSATGSNQMTVTRLTSVGAVDATFGTAGTYTTAIGAGAADGTALVIDSSGNIIIGGYSTNTEKDFAMMRLTSAGALDASFNSTGQVETDYTGLGGAANNNSIFGLALQSDGKIVAVGNAQAASYDFAIMRYWP